MGDAFFARPRPVSIEVNALTHCDGDVLMPGHLPVGGVGFVKESGANDEGTLAEDGFDDGMHSRVVGDLLKLR